MKTHTQPKPTTGAGNAQREGFTHTCPKCGSSALETRVEIIVCNGVGRKQAFRRGSHLIGYGETDLQAVENLIEKESYYKLQDVLYKP